MLNQKHYRHRYRRRGLAALEYLVLTAVFFVLGLMSLSLAIAWMAASHQVGDTISGWTLM